MIFAGRDQDDRSVREIIQIVFNDKRTAPVHNIKYFILHMVMFEKICLVQDVFMRITERDIGERDFINHSIIIAEQGTNCKYLSIFLY